MRDQRGPLEEVGGAVAVVPDRPGVAARHGAHPRKAVQARTRAGAVDLRPGRAVPVQDQRAGPAAVASAVVPDRPGVAARAGAYPVEGVVADRAWVGALDLRPGRAVPVQDQRLGHAAVAGVVGPDRPGIAARQRAHTVELAEARAWVGAFDLRPGRAVPVQDQRVPYPGGDVPV